MDSRTWLRMGCYVALALAVWFLWDSLRPFESRLPEEGLPAEKAAVVLDPMAVAPRAVETPDVDSPREPISGMTSIDLPEAFRNRELEVRVEEGGAFKTQSVQLDRAVAEVAWRTAERRNRVGTMAEPTVFDVEIVAPDGTTAIVPTTVLTETPGQPASARAGLRYRLETARARYGDGLYAVPLYVSVQERRGGDWVPRAVTEPVSLTLRDGAGKLAPRVVELPAGNPLPEVATVPLRPRSTYRLRVEPVNGAMGEGSEEVAVTWETHGPDLELKVLPEDQERFVTSDTPARFLVYLTDEGQRVRDPFATPLQASAPRGVRVDALERDDAGVWRAVAYASDSTDRAEIRFTHVDLGLETAARVRFDYPFLQLMIAVVAGLLGVLVARRKALFQQHRLAVALEVLTALVAAGLLYAGLVAGWFVVSLPSLLGLVPAAVVGVIGGYSGEAVFHLLVKRILPGVPPSGTPAGNAPPPPAAPTAAAPGG